MFAQRCLYAWHRSAACPDASRASFCSRGSVPEAWRVSSAPTSQFLPNAARLETFPPLLPRLSGYSLAKSTRLLHLAQMDAFRSCCSKGSCYDNILPGGWCFFFSSSFFEGGSRKPKAGQLPEQWERGRWIWVSHGWDKMEKEKESDSSHGQRFLKIFIFPCRTLRRGLAKWGGEGGGWRGAETERVHWLTEGCWTGMCFPKTLRTQKHDLKTTAHLQFPGWGPDAFHPVSSFCSGTGLSGLQQQVDVLSSKTTRRIPESPPIQFCLTQQSAYLEFQGHWLRSLLLVFIALWTLTPLRRACAAGRWAIKRVQLQHENTIHITERALCAADIQRCSETDGVCVAARTFSQTPEMRGSESGSGLRGCSLHESIRGAKRRGGAQ